MKALHVTILLCSLWSLVEQSLNAVGGLDESHHHHQKGSDPGTLPEGDELGVVDGVAQHIDEVTTHTRGPQRI